MTDIIQLLPDSVANQIAAGEVIQRPASVIKELMENAIDAGAKKIIVRVVDAGRTSIQVIDDGTGMSETDARLAFERHSTSKIRKAADLFSLHTMGFRGEALASIAAVAHVELKTRTQDDDIGTRLCIAGSKVLKQEPTACPVGCNFAVENLFFNVPARRKFLKSNATELRNIIEAFERIVLVYPQVAFTLYSNDSELINLRPAGSLQRISDVFGKKYAQDLLPITVDTTLCAISGFTGKPETARRKGFHQFFFVNGRYMKHPYFNKAVQSAYDRLVPTGEQVPYFIYIQVNPEDIDVNIHPTKTEIKFENEQTIWQILAAVVREAIGKFCEIPAIDFDTQGKPDIPVFDADKGLQAGVPSTGSTPDYNPFATAGADSNRAQPDSRTTHATVPRDWQTLYNGIAGGLDIPQSDVVPPAYDDGRPQSRPGPAESCTDQSSSVTPSPVHYQYKGRYIMTAVKSGLMIIDQHRAHLRILYDEYLRRIQTHSVPAQKLLFPETLQLTAADSAILDRLLPHLESVGVQLSQLGGGSYAVDSLPAGINGGDVTKFINELIASAAENDFATADALSFHSSQMADTIALSLARNAAIPYGQVLTGEEMDNIVNRLFACSNVNYTPDGRTILAILPQQQIDQLMR